jgi:probable rRNA maturation factor
MPIQYTYNTSFSLKNESIYSKWLEKVIESEQCVVGEIVYAFFNDNDLKSLNNKYLGRNYYTDVLSFNDSYEKTINGNIAISVDRVKENAKTFGVAFDHEMLRIMVHGLLHFLEYNDSTDDEKSEMTKKENEKIKMFHVER